MITFILGVIVGLLIALLNIVLFKRSEIAIKRNVDKLMNSTIIKVGSQAYIAGFSDEESAFAESLNKKEDIRLS